MWPWPIRWQLRSSCGKAWCLKGKQPSNKSHGIADTLVSQRGQGMGGERELPHGPGGNSLQLCTETPPGKQARWCHPNLCWSFPAETESSWGQTLLINMHQRPAAEKLQDVKVTSRGIHTLRAQLLGRQLNVHYLAHQQNFSPLWSSFNGTGEMCPFLKIPMWGPSCRRQSWWVWNSLRRGKSIVMPCKSALTIRPM